MERGLACLVITAGLAAAVVSGCSGGGSAPSHLTSTHRRTGPACRGRASWAEITLTDTGSEPVVTVSPGALVVVMVPPWQSRPATIVQVYGGTALREKCTILLADDGRRTIFVAVRPGRVQLSASVQPDGNLADPAWSGRVLVQAGR